MLRFVFGIGIPLVATVVAVILAGGRVMSMLHPAELMIILGFIIGGMIMAFGFTDSRKMLGSAFNPSKDCSPERLRRNILVCDGASKFSLYGGFSACFLGVVITMGSIGGDISHVGQRFAAAMTGLIFGAGIAGVVFQPLKFRFLGLLNELEEASREKAERPHEESLS